MYAAGLIEMEFSSSGEQVSQLPQPLRHSGLHRGRAPDRLMNPAEVVVREVQCEGRT